MTKSELNDCGLIWNTSRTSTCLDDSLKLYDGISKDITTENKLNSYNIITETLHNMIDVHDFLKRMTTCKIQLTKVEFEGNIISAYPEIHIEYFVPTDVTVPGVLKMPKNIGVDTCSIDDAIVYKHENKESKEEETILEFKEISW